MLVQVNGRGFELSTELREYVEEKVRATLSRFSPRIASVKAFLADENGPKRGLDKSLRLVIFVERRPQIVVEEQGETWYAVLNKTTERAVHAVSRHADRARSKIDRTSMSGGAEAALGTGLA